VQPVAPFAEVIAEIREAGGVAHKLCYQCGKCDAVCPWNRVRDFSIRRIIREATFGLTEIEGEDLWRCTTCGNCPEKCPRGVKQIELGVSLRRIASRYDVFPASARPARAVRGSLTTEGNPLNEPRARRADWAKGLGVKPFTEGTEVLYFGCCTSAYDSRMQNVARATVAVLQKAGVDFGILGTRESCCGESVRKTGAEDVYKGLARENIKTFIDAGVKRIVVSSPHCYEVFKKDYAELMVRFEVVHMAQLLADLVREGRIVPHREYGKRVAYHDPCYLGRHNGVFDEPREVLRRVRGLELVELANARHDSLCCGGGGGRVWMDTPKGERFSNIRLVQARDAGASVLATACPYCITMFEDSRLSLECEETIEIKDISEIIAEVI
jgi:Fe-S oxidoreductase